MRVLPASTPDALLTTMLIVGPALRMRCTAIPMATTAARIGMIHTTDIRKPFCRDTLASGRLLRSFSLGIAKFVRVCGIPDQARVEGFGREHGQYHHGGKEQHAWTRL